MTDQPPSPYVRIAANSEPHHPTGECAADHCYSHNLDEPMDLNNPDRIVCGECFHYFPDARALRRDYRRMYIRFLRNTDGHARPYAIRHTLRLIARLPFVRRVEFCPHCTHDL